MAAAHTCTRRDGTAVGIKTSIRLWAKARAGGNWIGGRGVEGPGVCCFAESLVPSWKGTIGCAMRIGTDGPPRRSLPAGTTFLPAPCPPPSGPNSLPVLTLLRLDFFFSSSCSSTPAPLFFFFFLTSHPRKPCRPRLVSTTTTTTNAQTASRPCSYIQHQPLRPWPSRQ